MAPASHQCRAAVSRERGPAPLSTIAQHTGYTSEFAFAKAFKRHFGSPPGAYRKQLRTAADEPGGSDGR
ncbi:helix-turn-helix domain-containing protein [Kitasatospora aureofaciens]